MKTNKEKVLELIGHLIDGGKLVSSRGKKRDIQEFFDEGFLDCIIKYPDSYTIVKELKKNVVELYVSGVKTPEIESDFILSYLGLGSWNNKVYGDCTVKVRITVEEIDE